METDKHYFTVGSFVLLIALAAIGFALWMVGPRDKSKYTPYSIRFSESVSGLSVGGLVKFRGVDVGRVDSIAIDEVDTRFIRVNVSILNNTPIKTDTVASLKLAGITGVVFVELTGSSPQAPALASDADHVAEIPAEPSSINAIVNILPEILQKVSMLTEQIGKIFNNDTIAAIDNTVAQWEKISTAIAAQSGQIAQLIENSNAVAGDVHDIVRNSKADIQSLTAHLNQTSEQLNQLISRTNNAAGGQYQALYQLLTELKTTSRDVSELARSLKEDPSRVLRPVQEKGIPAP